MSDRPTPETEAALLPDGEYRGPLVWAEHARRLERQRDEWHGAFLLATKRAGDAGELLVELKRQRDELLKALESITRHRPIMGSTGDYREGQAHILESVTRIAKAAIDAVKGGEG
jgi:hypothetical protein